MIDFAKVLKEQKECPHQEVYFSISRNNFYCKKCYKGMGQKFYEKHLNDSSIEKRK